MPQLGADTTTTDVLDGADLTGRVILVTGASAGLGLETSRSLAAHGATVVMAVRDRERGEKAMHAIRGETPDADLELRIVDLASLASIRSIARELRADRDRLDVLIANAGVMACPFGRTNEGFEMQFGTNHLGHFLLAELLAPMLVAGAPSRLVVLSSAGHRISDVDLGDPNFEQAPYDKWLAYGRAKTANVLFAVEFDRRYSGQGARAYAVHPGTIVTELGRHLTAEDRAMLTGRSLDDDEVEDDSDDPSRGVGGWKSVEAGAATTVWAATTPLLDGVGGRYLEDCGVAECDDDPAARRGYRSYATDPDSAAALWSLSTVLVGIDEAPVGSS